MVQEIRRIIFNNDDLLAALESYARTNPKFMPAGKIVSCVTEDDGHIKLKIEAQYGNDKHMLDLTYSGADVLRPMIMYCIENNIMLPRDGRKNFFVKDKQAVLNIELDLLVDMAATAAPLKSDQIRLITVEGDMQPQKQKA